MHDFNGVPRSKSLTCKRSKVKSTKKSMYSNKKVEFLNNCNYHAGNMLTSSHILKYDLSQKFNANAFEDFITKTDEKNMHFTSFICNLRGFKENLEDSFEVFLDKWKDYWMGIREKIVSITCEMREKKEDIIDDFEGLIEKLKDVGSKTNKQVKQIKCLKEQAIDSFENLIDTCNDYILYVEENVKCYANGKKTAIVDDFKDMLYTVRNTISSVQWSMEDGKNQLTNHLDDMICSLKDNVDGIHWLMEDKKSEVINNFDDIVCNLKHNISCLQCTIDNKKEEIIDDFENVFENTKWLFKDKRNALVEDAELVFDNILDKIKKIIELGQCEIKQQIYSINHAISLSEFMAKHFISYCEKGVNEFCRFSEKQIVSLICGGKKKAQVFYNEVVDSLVRGYEDKLLCDNLVLEINSSRYAYNVTMSEVNFHVVRALLTLPGPDGRTWQQLASRLTYFMPILTNYIRTEAAQKDCLLGLEDVASCNEEIFDVLVKIIHWLYEQDILSEEIILNWYSNPSPDVDSNNAKKVRNQVAPFIRWLKEAEEQSTDSDDE